jgi:hypothetical protein
MTLLLKDPEATLDYCVEWGTEYLSDDALAESSWTVSPAERAAWPSSAAGSTSRPRQHKWRAGSPGGCTADQPCGDGRGSRGQPVDHAAGGEALVIATNIAEAAVSMAEAQAYARVETGEEEALLAGLVRTASALCESFVGQVLVARPFEEGAAAGRWMEAAGADPGPDDRGGGSARGGRQRDGA